MKYLFYFLLISLVSVSLVACGAEEETGTSASAGENNQEDEIREETTEPEEVVEEEGDIEVDKNLLSVEITMPATMFEEEDVESSIAEAEAEGITVTPNDDGSYTYKMSKGTHADMMEEMKTSMTQSIENLKTSGEYPSIVDVVANGSFSEFKVVVNREEFENSFDGFAVLGVVFGALYYQLFDGVNPDDYKVIINYEDAATGEQFDSVVYPDALEELE
ncbi:hypothetical protein [Bacillus suaedae]|uniref:Antigen I/II N-terminal domain-containing protein n=1 Tax=Halalkalibacter suaedae TaxID=2822140 RepID=A0A940WVL0_9BACI|nr:hypothetical protein [Bacillus suaedae]MBP3951138.1 hypothetical protein [Bacillus suaedae]